MTSLVLCRCAVLIVLKALVFKCGWSEEPRWKKVFQRRLYASSAAECPQLQQRLAAIFAQRQHSIWRDAEGVEEWLFDNAEKAVRCCLVLFEYVC